MKTEENLILKELVEIKAELTRIKADITKLHTNNDDVHKEVNQTSLQVNDREKTIEDFKKKWVKPSYYLYTDKTLFDALLKFFLEFFQNGKLDFSAFSPLKSGNYVAATIVKLGLVYLADDVADYTVVPLRKACYDISQAVCDRSIDPILEEIVYPLVTAPLNYVAYPIINIASDYIVNPIYDSMPTPIKETACDLRNKTYDSVIEPIGEFWSDLEITI